jgi:hypothetical protein
MGSGAKRWAFSPMYRLTVRRLMSVTGLKYSVVTATLSRAQGAALTQAP